MSTFSFDLLALIADILLCSFPTATKGAKPQLLFSFGSDGEGDGQFSIGCSGITVGPGNEIWVSSQRKVQVFNGEDGKFLFHAAPGHWKDRVYGMAFDSNGEVFIADCSAHRIVVCGLDGSFVRAFGSEGGNNGQFQGPRDVIVDFKGLVFVADTDNQRVQVLTRSGEFVQLFGSAGRHDGQFNDPVDVALDLFTDRGELVILEHWNQRIQVICQYNVCELVV